MKRSLFGLGELEELSQYLGMVYGFLLHICNATFPMSQLPGITVNTSSDKY